MSTDHPFITHIRRTLVVEPFHRLGRSQMEVLRVKKLRDRKGVSPVIATVILVAVTIVVAVAVAYWMGSITGLYTRSENLQIVGYFMTKSENVTVKGVNSTGWEITLTVKNAGSMDATITDIFINGQPIRLYSRAAPANSTLTPIAIGTGKIEELTLHILQDEDSVGEGFTPGTRIEVKLHTGANMDYPQMMTLT